MSQALPRTDWIWKDGEWLPWEAATVHVLSHVVHYGSAVFEGIRCYETPAGPAVFRLQDHIDRLFASARVYRMEPRASAAALAEACRRLVARNGLRSCYVRPIVLRGFGAPGLNPGASPVETFVACWPWDAYLGAGALERGASVRASSWQRPAPNTFPALAKAAGNYLSSQLIKMEAAADGYDDGIALGPGGLVSEGSGQNVFLVVNGTLLTPALDGTLLAGLTRDCVLRLAADLGIPASERAVPRELLYTADEVFFTGTATEITPVCSIDRIAVGHGTPGPVTRALQERLFGIARGTLPDVHGWLDPVGAAEAAETVEEAVA